jgi:hypothetical protein
MHTEIRIIKLFFSLIFLCKNRQASLFSGGSTMPKTIFYRVFLSIIIVLAYTTLLFISMVSLYNIRLNVSQADENARALLQIYNDDMDDLLFAISSIPVLLSTHPTLLTNGETEQNYILKRHYDAASSSFSSLLLIDVHGHLITGYPQRETFYNIFKEELPFLVLPDIPYSNKLFRVDNTDYILVPAIHPETKQLAAYIVAVLNYADGSIMSSIRSFASHPMDFYALKDDGTVFAHNISDLIGKERWDKDVIFEGERVTLGNALAKGLNDTFSLNYEFNGTLRLGTLIYNENFDLFFVTSRPLETVQGKLLALWSDLSWMLLGITTVMVLICFYISYSITKPIKALEHYVHNLSSFSTPHPYEGKQKETKELRTLRETFEKTVNSLKEAHFSVINVLTKAVEEKDPYTHGHAERVTNIAMQIADKMALSDKEKYFLRYSALLHDVGKLATPEHILKKQKLNDSEWEIMRQHPSTSKSIVAQSDFLQSSIPGIFHHHERFDGGGYPSGLEGSNIPVQARIIAVADAFDAMTTNRPYRKAITASEALAEIRRESGKQFDPEVVEAFLAIKL